MENNNFNQQEQQPVYEQPQQPAQAPVYEQPAQAPVYAQPVYAPVQQLESLASSALTMGILSLVFTCTFFLSFLGIIFGAIGKSRAKQFALLNGVPAGKAKVGSILSTIGLIFGIILTVIVFLYVVLIIFILETNFAF